MARRIEQYKSRFARGTNLAAWAEFWGPVFTDLDLRIAFLEGIKSTLETTLGSLEALALQRLADAFTPLILDAQHRLATLGVSFSGTSTTPVDLPHSGSVTLTMPEAVAANYVFTDYVSCRSEADQSQRFLGQVTLFQRELEEHYTLASPQTTAGVTSIGVNEVISTDLPTSGTIHIGNHAFEYTSYSGSIFTTLPEDFTSFPADENDDVTIKYGALTVDVVDSDGSGTFSDWLIRVGAPPDLSHANRTDNPHETTAAQVGAYTIAQSDTAIAVAIAAAIAALPPFDSSPLARRDQNLNDLLDKAAARSNLGLKALALLDAVGWNQIASNIPATGANFRANTALKFLTPNAVWDAAAFVPLTDAPTIAVDFQNGFNFNVVLGASRILGFPQHIKVGQSGTIDVKQPGGGNCNLGFEAGYTYDNGLPPTLDPVGNRVTALIYQARAANEVRIGTFARGAR